MSIMFRAQRDATAVVSGGAQRGWFGRPPRKKPHLANDAVWACVSLRGDLISTLPIDTYRKAPWGQVEVPKPPILVEPGGSKVDIGEWMYSSQTDLDSVGNAFGKITEVDGNRLPRRIDLVAREDVRVTSRNGEVTYWFQGVKQDPESVWHERQYTTSGTAVGLSPVAYAALALLQHSSAQDFAAAWFGGGIMPASHLRYSETKVPPAESEAIKARFMLSIENGEPFVTGKDWEFKPIDAAAAQATFIESMQFTDVQVCRFFGVPGDLIDANTSGSSITYANITQRNLQFLIMKLGPAIARRERALSRLLPSPRFVKLNSDALLRMDPETASRMLGQQVRDRLRVPTEARGLLNLAPFTDEQIEEFKTLFPAQYPDKPSETQRALTIGENA